MVEEVDPALEEVKQLFFEECSELLSDAGARLSNLQENLGDVDVEDVHAIFRAVHSVKGGAGAWGFQELSKFAHTFESLLGQIRDGNALITEDLVSVLFHANDVLVDLLQGAQQGLEADEEKWIGVADQLKALTPLDEAPSSDGTSSKSDNSENKDKKSVSSVRRKKKRKKRKDNRGSFPITFKDGSATIDLKAILDLSVATDLKLVFTEITDGSGDVVVYGEHVEHITTPCIQLLLACARELETSGRSFKFQKPSRILRDSFLELGLGSEMERWT